MFIVIKTTYPNNLQGQELLSKLRTLLINQSLAICVQDYQVNSQYFWQGKIISDQEIVVEIKAKEVDFPEINRCIKSLHCYQTPEIIYHLIAGGDKDYLKWLDNLD